MHAEIKNLFCSDLLSEAQIVLAGTGELAQEICTVVGQLGGGLERVDLAGVKRHLDGSQVNPERIESEVEQAVNGVLVSLKKPANTVIVDVAGVEDGQEAHGMLTAVDLTWAVVRSTANAALISGQGGRVVLLAPTARSGDPESHAVRAALANMARTLSIEWSQYGVRVVTVLPGSETTPQEMAALTAYLVSPAGEYFSGCVFELGTV